MLTIMLPVDVPAESPLVLKEMLSVPVPVVLVVGAVIHAPDTVVTV